MVFLDCTHASMLTAAAMASLTMSQRLEIQVTFRYSEIGMGMGWKRPEFTDLMIEHST